MKIGQLIDKWEVQDASIRKMEEDLKLLKQQRAVMEKDILNTLDDEGLESAAGKNKVVSKSEQTVYRVQDWEAFYKYVRRNNMFELLHKRLAVTTAKDLRDAGKRLPWLAEESFVKLSVRSRR